MSDTAPPGASGGGAGFPQPPRSPVTTSNHDFDLLRRAYRVLRDDYAALEATMAHERASHAAAAAERGKLLARTEAAERKCRMWEEEVLVGARRGAAALERHAARASAATIDSATPAPAPGTAAAIPGGLASGAGPGESGVGGRWADRVMTGVTIFSSALSTSIESVSALAVPPSVQETLDEQEETLIAYEHVQRLMRLEVSQMEASLVGSDTEARQAIREAEQRANVADARVASAMRDVTDAKAEVAAARAAAVAAEAAAEEATAAAQAEAKAAAAAAVAAAASAAARPAAEAVVAPAPVPHLPFASYISGGGGGGSGSSGGGGRGKGFAPAFLSPPSPPKPQMASSGATPPPSLLPPSPAASALAAATPRYADPGATTGEIHPNEAAFLPAEADVAAALDPAVRSAGATPVRLAAVSAATPASEPATSASASASVPARPPLVAPPPPPPLTIVDVPATHPRECDPE